MIPLLQQLAPASARLCLAVEHFLVDELALSLRGGRFVLGVSGGADSTALLLIMLALARRWDARLAVAHLDHCLRPESAAEAAHVAALCRRWAVPCTIFREDIRSRAAAARTGLEDAGRRARYQCFEHLRLECGADWIATAHHGGDLEEDVLLRLLRGAGWPALGGMRATDPERHLIRPLLLTDPEELRALLRREGIAWVEDASNASRDFRRNRLRHDVLPLLRQENPSLRTGIRQLWRQARADEAHWNALLEASLAAHPLHRQEHVLVAGSDLLSGMDGALRLRLCRRIVQECGGTPRADALRALEAAWTARRGNARIQFPGGVTACIAKGSILFSISRQKCNTAC